MKNIKSIIVVSCLLLAIVAGYFVAGTYAKYVGTVSQTGSATVAKWAFEDQNTLVGTLNLNIAPSAHTTTLDSGKIAPGTSGHFDISLVNSQTEVGVDVSVTISESNVPTNLKFYTDDEYTTELNDANPLTGTMEAKEDTALTKTIYWRWEYETGTAPYTTGDAADTTDGEAAETMTVTLNITGTQVTPGTSAITTGWN